MMWPESTRPSFSTGTCMSHGSLKDKCILKGVYYIGFHTREAETLRAA